MAALASRVVRLRREVADLQAVRDPQRRLARLVDRLGSSRALAIGEEISGREAKEIARLREPARCGSWRQVQAGCDRRGA